MDVILELQKESNQKFRDLNEQIKYMLNNDLDLNRVDSININNVFHTPMKFLLFFFFKVIIKF